MKPHILTLTWRDLDLHAICSCEARPSVYPALTRERRCDVEALARKEWTRRHALKGTVLNEM